MDGLDALVERWPLPKGESVLDGAGGKCGVRASAELKRTRLSACGARVRCERLHAAEKSRLGEESNPYLQPI